ncbi:hypothetical protein GOODEAATRI_000743, partial [Goodea atripinnis]
QKPTHGPCAEEEYKCSNGQCIPIQYACDDYDDCGDESDELGCRKLPTAGTRKAVTNVSVLKALNLLASRMGLNVLLKFGSIKRAYMTTFNDYGNNPVKEVDLNLRYIAKPEGIAVDWVGSLSSLVKSADTGNGVTFRSGDDVDLGPSHVGVSVIDTAMQMDEKPVGSSEDSSAVEPSPFVPPAKPQKKDRPSTFSPTEDSFKDTANLVKEDRDV